MFSVVDQGIVSGTNFLTALIIARTCLPEDLGRYYLAWTIVMFLASVSGNLVSVPYTMYCHRHQGQSLASHAGSALVHHLAISLVAAGGLLGLACLLWAGVGPQSLRPLAWVLAGVMPLVLLREFVRRVAFAHLAVRTAMAVDLAVSGLQLTGILLLVCFHRLSIPAIYLVMGGACGTACAAWFAAGAQPLRFTLLRIASDWRDHWFFGRWALPGQLGSLALYMLPWMLVAVLGEVAGEAAAGVLAACNTLVGPANLFVTGMSNFVIPKTAQAFAHGGGAAVSQVMRATLLLFVAVLGTFCVATWFAGDLLLALFGRGYSGSGAVIVVLALATLTDAVGLTAGSGLWALHRPAANFAADAVQTVVMVAAAACLLAPLGAMGVALALVAGRSAGAAMRWLVLRAALAAGPGEPPLETTL
jgi:O-antigen/teichoic acid export membrane protein